MNPLITVVSGTINRISLLKGMIFSARKEARFLPICFIIVDSNSNDGTADWCKAQPDIIYVQAGNPRGAIRAFTDGGMLSKTRYTILANDDITFRPYSILSAYRHLEDNPRIGGIAFADNRNTPRHTTQRHGARNAQGIQVGSTYAQVGMFRTPLMQGAGVWGADDPLFGGAWTYGGDDYLTSRIWEFGYTIHPAPLCEIDDHLHKDETRAIGYSKGANDARLYHSRFDSSGRGQGAIFGSHADSAPYCDTTPAYRILQMPDIEPVISPQDVQMVGLTEALNYEADVLRYPYTLRARDLGVIDMQIELSMIARVFAPHLVFMQCQSTGLINAPFIAELKKHLPSPRTRYINWNGDYWREKLFNPPMLELLRQVDAQLVVDYAVIPTYADKGITAHYWQVAPETPDFTALLDDTPCYDVLFMGANYSKARKDLIRFLHGLKAKGLKVGLYGIAFPPDIPSDGITYYDFARSQALMHNAGVVIGAMEFQDSDGYVSNRLFEALQARAVLLQQRVINADSRLGIIGGVHCEWWDTFVGLEALIHYYLKNRDKAFDMARRGKQFVEAHHSNEIRVQALFKILEEL
jgi:hypothetical protein